MTLSGSFKAFLADEDGSATVWNLLWSIVFMMFAGMAIDLSNGYQSKAVQQATADSSALAAVMDLPDKTTARQTALDYAVANMAPGVFGDVLKTQDVYVGQWFSGSRTFVAGLEPPDAVAVVVRRSTQNDNEIGTTFTRILSADKLNVNALAIAAIVPPSNCLNSGLLAAGRLSVAGNATFNDGFCLYGKEGVKIQENIWFDPGDPGYAWDGSRCIDYRDPDNPVEVDLSAVVEIPCGVSLAMNDQPVSQSDNPDEYDYTSDWVDCHDAGTLQIPCNNYDVVEAELPLALDAGTDRGDVSMNMLDYITDYNDAYETGIAPDNFPLTGTDQWTWASFLTSGDLSGITTKTVSAYDLNNSVLTTNLYSNTSDITTADAIGQLVPVDGSDSSMSYDEAIAYYDANQANLEPVYLVDANGDPIVLNPDDVALGATPEYELVGYREAHDPWFDEGSGTSVNDSKAVWHVTCPDPSYTLRVPGGKNIQNFGMVVDCKVQLGADLTMGGVFLGVKAGRGGYNYGGHALKVGANATIGRDDGAGGCNDAGKVIIAVEGDFHQPAGGTYNQADVFATGDVKITANSDGMNSVTVISGGDVDVTANGDFGTNCDSGSDLTLPSVYRLVL